MPARRMLLASRAQPPKLLQVPKLTSKNSAFKDFLLHSPLPSPALPSILPRHGKKPPALNTRRALRYLTWLFILTGTFYLLSWFRRVEHKATEQVYRHANGHSYEIVEDSQLPDYSSPLAVIDTEGESRWTIHIPANRGFPLPAKEYQDICSHVYEVAQHVATTRGNEKDIVNLQYYDQDPNYIDVAEAQLSDLIPFDPSFKPGGQIPVCKSSMIYVLDATDAGLGGSLLGLWLAYGLAQREKRSFFIDDSHFAYGKYRSLFEHPPPPSCRPPPPTHRVPCPRMSQHLVVSSATWQWTFGEAFHQKFTDKQIFDMMRVGYETLFKLLPDDQLYVASRITQLRKEVGEGKLLAGMHIRRGDRHPDEFQYQHGYIPPAEYATALQNLVEATTTTFLSATSTSKRNYTLILASDDADMYHDPELNGLAIRAQERISLTSNKQLTEGGLGWERGFFKDSFWSLGVPENARKQKHFNSPLPTRDSKYEQKVLGTDSGEVFDPRRDYRSDPTPEALQLRKYVGRAYLLDLAVLAQSDRLVCAASSRGCRILAIMMGWEQVDKGHWRNIDEGESTGWRSQL